MHTAGNVIRSPSDMGRKPSGSLALPQNHLKSTDNLMNFNSPRADHLGPPVYQTLPSRRSGSRVSLNSQQRRDPEHEKDFKKAYESLVEKMYNEQGQQISGLLTEEEIARLEHAKRLNENAFLERVHAFQKAKEEKLMER